MATQIQGNFRVRKNFAKITKIIDIPNLINQTGDALEETVRAKKLLTFKIRKT